MCDLEPNLSRDRGGSRTPTFPPGRFWENQEAQAAVQRSRHCLSLSHGEQGQRSSQLCLVLETSHTETYGNRVSCRGAVLNLWRARALEKLMKATRSAPRKRKAHASLHTPLERAGLRRTGKTAANSSLQAGRSASPDRTGSPRRRQAPETENTETQRQL